MTVSATYTPDVSLGDGANDTFPYTFRILKDADIQVQIKDLNGAFTTKVITTEYTVSGAGDQSGGNIVFTAGNIPLSTDTVVLSRDIDILQETDYKERGTFPAESHEEALDELTMISQQINDNSIRSIRVDESVTGFSSTFTATANGYLRVASDALSIETPLVAPGEGIQDVVDDTSPQSGNNWDYNGFNADFDDNTGIRDDSGNEHLIFQKTASAVNHFEATNAATGNSPLIKAVGDDASVDMRVASQGTSGDIRLESASGGIIVPGTASTASYIRLHEDTDNGTNYIGLKSPATVASSLDFVLPSADGTSGQLLETDGSLNLSFVTGPSKILATVSASSDSSIDFDNFLDSTYPAYLLRGCNLIAASDAVELMLRVGTGATPTYQSGASDYQWTHSHVNSSAGSATYADAADSEISISGSVDTIGNAAGEESNFEVIIYCPSDGATYTRVSYKAVYGASAGYTTSADGGGTFLSTTAVTSLRILLSGATNITSGEFTLIGLK